MNDSDSNTELLYMGLDLSGPSNPGDTALSWFAPEEAALSFAGQLTDTGDSGILDLLRDLYDRYEVLFGVDAPLSYQDGGGRRDCDTDLSSRLTDEGLDFIGVMAPTYSKMGWLTLRGIGLARSIELMPEAHRVRIVEVHPGATMGLHGAPKKALRRYKRGDMQAIHALQSWFAEEGMGGLPEFDSSSHVVDSCAAALAAWRWHTGDSAWLAEARPPERPYDFAC